MGAMTRRRRGEPLVLLGLVLLIWGFVRAMAWGVPDGLARSFSVALFPRANLVVADAAAKPRAHGLPVDVHAPNFSSRARSGVRSGAGREIARWPDAPNAALIAGLSDEPFRLSAGKAGRKLAETTSHPFVGRAGVAPGIMPMGGRIDDPGASRWSADGWFFLRGKPAEGTGQSRAPVGTYGGSQFGMVLRRLLGETDLGPVAFARLAGSLGADKSEYREIAGGLSVRPLRSVPLSLVGEARVQQSDGQARVRPGISVVTGLPPVDMGTGWRAEFYGQAGYVAGRGATRYFDGQALVHRSIFDVEDFQVRAGAGAWTGGQTEAQRLDLGPSASARLPLGNADVRVSIDWRFRIAGKAAPGSGPAVTLAAGF